jgi:hypothetical protein
VVNGEEEGTSGDPSAYLCLAHYVDLRREKSDRVIRGKLLIMRADVIRVRVGCSEGFFHGTRLELGAWGIDKGRRGRMTYGAEEKMGDCGHMDLRVENTCHDCLRDLALSMEMFIGAPRRIRGPRWRLFARLLECLLRPLQGR